MGYSPCLTKLDISDLKLSVSLHSSAVKLKYPGYTPGLASLIAGGGKHAQC